MPTLHADSSSRAIARAIAQELTSNPKEYGLKNGMKVDVQAATGATDELALAASGISMSVVKSGWRYKVAMTLTVTRMGMAQRLPLKNLVIVRTGEPTEKEKLEALAEVAAYQVGPLLMKKPAKATKAAKAPKTIHINGYFTQTHPAFRKRIVSQVASLGFRTKVTLGLSGIEPDSSCWGFLTIPLLNMGRWEGGKLALSPATGRAGLHEAKVTIRANVDPSLSEAAATRLLADKLVAWYGKLAVSAQGVA
ncbi:MAG: hypothetical protein JST54_34400 [Deltaproteobacteria bacterium]|nr:hypothetical protein [Deltaproteobacteria bacterium]